MGTAPTAPFFTLGHSTRSIDEFVGPSAHGEHWAYQQYPVGSALAQEPAGYSDVLPRSLAEFGLQWLGP
jgi:hypothetical protein